MHEAGGLSGVRCSVRGLWRPAPLHAAAMHAGVGALGGCSVACRKGLPWGFGSSFGLAQKSGKS